MMKKAVSISIGSSKRDKKVEVELLGEMVEIARIGTDGDTKKAAEMYTASDGKVDAIGVGGSDLGFMVENKFYPMHSIYKMTSGVKHTPLVDGNGLRSTLEPKVKEILEKDLAGYIKEKRAFVLAGIDRWGLTRTISDLGFECIYGDLMFGLGIPLAIHSIKAVKRLAALLMPIIGYFPFNWLYPTGKEQEKRTPKWEKYFNWATLIVGDCNYITRYGPERMDGKVIITNTTTPQDREQFKNAGVKYLITTTPVLEGRSFGTNMMEAAINAAMGWKEPVDYFHPTAYIKKIGGVVDKMNMKPTLQELN
jgi:hypothetical protein